MISLYGQILEMDPSDEQALDALCAKYEKMRRWPDLVGLLRQRLEDADGEDREAVALRIASVYLDKMRNQMEAIRAYEEVLALNPESQAAMQALDGLYEKRRDWEQLIAIRVRLAESLPEDEMLAAYKSLADYATRKIRRPDITRTLWEEIQSLDPDDVDAMRALATIYEQTKDFQALVDALDRLVELVEEPSEQVSLLQKAGSVYQDRLKDAGRAAEIWSRLLELEPQNRRAGDSYKKALLELGDWDTLTAFFLNAERGGELVRVLESQVGVQEDEAAKLDLLFRAAAVYLDPLDKADRAVRAFERILQADPSNQQAAASLEPIYTENSDYRKLVGVLEILLSAASDVELRVEYMRRLAALAEQNLRDPMGAFDWNRRVLSEAADHAEARADVLRLGELTQQWGLVHDSLVEALPGLYETEDQLQVFLALGRILDEELGSYDEALGRYHEALELDSDNLGALDAVEQLYTRTGRWYDLLETLERKIALAEDDAGRIALIRRQASIHEEQLEDPQAAIDSYRSLLEIDEEDADALAALQRLFADSEQGADLQEILERQLKIALASERRERHFPEEAACRCHARW